MYLGYSCLWLDLTTEITKEESQRAQSYYKTFVCSVQNSASSVVKTEGLNSCRTIARNDVFLFLDKS
jgi:hypothetical protein